MTDLQRLAEIERHLSEATPGTHERDCGGHLFATIDGEVLRIGEAYASGDARLWRHAGTDIRWLLDEVRRLSGLSASGIYVASRASITERGRMWRQLRAEGWPIVSTWIDQIDPGQTPDLGALWAQQVFPEIHRAAAVVLYVEASDLPLKGAIGEACAALAMGKPVHIAAPDLSFADLDRTLGSWVHHPLVTVSERIEDAMSRTGQRQGGADLPT